MGLVKLLFSFNGRINRAQYWTGTLGVSSVHFVVTMMTGFSHIATAANAANPAAALSGALGATSFAALIGVLAVWASLALQVKRFHDRGRTGWLAAIPIVLLIWFIVALLDAVLSNAQAQQTLGALGLPFGLMMLAALAFFIDLGCLSGEPETNKYGDPPGAPPSGGVQPRMPNAPNTKPSAAPAATSLLSAEAAMARAIAERHNSAPARKPAASAPVPMPPRYPATSAPAPATPTGFGRRPAR